MRRLHRDATAWHVFSRGTRRLFLFRDDEDFSTFLQCLAFALRDSGCELWAYALMSNHYHLVLFGSSNQVTRCMYQADRIYARYHNRKYLLAGHVFEGPYKAIPIATDGFVLWTLAYVFLNPVKAGLCGAPESYAWSGYRDFTGQEGSPLGVAASAAMSRLRMPPEEAWERFYRCIQVQQSRPPKKRGNQPTLSKIHMDQFEWLLQQAHDNPFRLAGEDPVQVASYWARQVGITPRVIAMALEIGSSAPVRKMIHRFKKRLEAEPSLIPMAVVP